jgi:polyribonucleotide nucleotidyltransferase
MFNTQSVSLEWAGRTLTIETGHVARQADGAVMVTYGDTKLLATAVFAKSAKPGQDFFPLTVNYQEKYFAAGRIPGGYFKREGRPTEKETLVSRLIDRPIRPLFVNGFKNEVQVIVTVLSYDLENDADVIGMIGASAALVLSGAPFMGPIGAARVGYINGQYVINPTVAELEESDLDLVLAGTADAVMMVESEAYELSEDVMLGAVVAGHDAMQPVINAIIDLAEKAAKEAFEFDAEDNSAAVKAIQDIVGKDLSKAYKITAKAERYAAVGEAREKAKAALVGGEGAPGEMSAEVFKTAFKEAEAAVVRGDIIRTGERIDGRKLDQIRPILAEAGFLPRTHGSALFTRGETQAICVTTLGTSDDEQYIEGLDGTKKEKFMLHYNFPPYSVGETGRLGGAGRREIGHGKLAWRALQAVLPKHEDFPYTIRLVSEITESNGSSSMATVCGCSLAMMDAGVPITRPVSGIAMGLILEGKDFAILSDILGDEDHLGDMDFKVAGTEKGITSLQMDIKVAGITREIMGKALDQAKGGRHHILGEMAKGLSSARGKLADTAPQMEIIKVPVDKIRDVIGSGGKVIRGIVDESGAKVNIEDDGTVQISALDRKSIDAAIKMIRGITAEAEVGQIYEGKVVSMKDFGIFVNFFGPKDGLVHVSQMANKRIGHPKEMVKEGDKVWVKLMGFDERGKVRLSMKVVDQATGREIEGAEAGADE